MLPNNISESIEDIVKKACIRECGPGVIYILVACIVTATNGNEYPLHTYAAAITNSDECVVVKNLKLNDAKKALRNLLTDMFVGRTGVHGQRGCFKLTKIRRDNTRSMRVTDE